MGKRKGYIFTDKKGSNRAIMAVILGIISIAALGAVIFAAYRSGGTARPGYGFTGLLALVYSVIGLILGIVTLLDKSYYKPVPVAAILLNTASLACIGLILYMGGYLW